MKFWPSYKKGRRRRSMKKSESAKFSKKKKHCIRDKRRTRQDKIRWSWKNSEEQGTSPVSNRWRNESSSPKSKTKKEKPSRRERESQMFTLNFTKLVRKRGKWHRTRNRVAHRRRWKILINTYPFQNLHKMRFKMPSTDWKKGKAKDSNGIRAEQLNNCSDDTKEKSGRSSMKLLDKKTSHRKAGARSESRSSTRKVTEKMQAITGQFAAACSVLYKLFATVLYARLAPSLHKIRPPDQGGFRPNHRTDDHLMVYSMLEQRCREWGVPLYISTVDFTKAFEWIKHSALWNSLHYYGVEPAHVRLLQRLYSQQEGTVLTEREWHISDQKRNEARWPTVLLTR